MIHKVVHLYSRWIAMGEPPLPLTNEELSFVQEHLLPSECALWQAMDASDRRHSFGVAQNFMKLCPEAERAEVAAALLHDVGKAVCGLQRNARALATLGSFSWPPFRWYRNHERFGARTLQHIGSDQRTVVLVAGRARDRVAKALQAADNTTG
jgi:hypothetical protein